MNICVIGTGYVGLVTGTVFADLGNDVICIDKDAQKVASLKQGHMPIYEPGLEEMVQHNVADGRLKFSTDIDQGVRESELIFIAVGTPPKDNGETDLSQVEGVAHDIAKHINEYKVIVNKSTVPVGTGDFVRQIIEANKNCAVDFDVVSNPEFLREGSAIADALCPERIVVGAPNQSVAMKLLELYASMERPMLITDVPSAEMIKYASNAFLATKISFANAIADVCEAVGADVTQVVKGMGYDHRIGPEFLQPGLGFGGSCFPKDTDSLIHTAAKFGVDIKLLRNVVEVNQLRVPHFMEIIRQGLGEIKGKTLAILGLAFKPNTDDMREAKSVELIDSLLKAGATVNAYDPVAMDNARQIMPHINYCANPYEAASGSNAFVIVTEWREFKLLNLEKIRNSMKSPIIFDGRNIYNPDRKRRLGFTYYSIGRNNNC